LVKQFRKRLYACIKENPTMSINQIYKQVQLEFFMALIGDNLLFFQNEIPTYREIQAGLYKDRQQYIPKAPLSQMELDASCPWFKDGDECLLKIDHSFENGRRVIGITSNETLEILARSTAVSLDGTFKICPSLWSQVFIVCCEVVPTVWVPVLFGYLPDKKL
jgi:hypothetical protein